jgi:hypothetical protein
MVAQTSEEVVCQPGGSDARAAGQAAGSRHRRGPGREALRVFDQQIQQQGRIVGIILGTTTGKRFPVAGQRLGINHSFPGARVNGLSKPVPTWRILC